MILIKITVEFKLNFKVYKILRKMTELKADKKTKTGDEMKTTIRFVENTEY